MYYITAEKLKKIIILTGKYYNHWLLIIRY